MLKMVKVVMQLTSVGELVMGSRHVKFLPS